jgi:hypothetical protein
MAGIEIREYSGDFEDLAELTRRVWTAVYAGKMWFSLPDAPTLRCWAQGGRCIAAYHGTKVVGSIFSIPYSLRIQSSVLCVPQITGFTVDSDHRRVAVPLVHRLNRFHQERDIAFGIGVLGSDRTSVSYRFWTRYQKVFPQRFRFLFRSGHWFKILAPRAMTRAGVTAWERLASSTLGPLLSATPRHHDPQVRPARSGDLDQCAEMLNRASAGFDWAIIWSAKQLANELEDPALEALVFERDGHLQGMVRYRRLSTYGREPVHSALIDLWADDGLTYWQRVKMLGHVCNHLRVRDVHIALALRSSMMPASAFAANLFLPSPPVHVVAPVIARPELVPPPPKTWSLVLT